jgi:hypothetical protein
MNASTAIKPHRARTRQTRSNARVRIYRSELTGQWMTDDIVGKNGKLLVKGGPITEGAKRTVLFPQGATILSASRLRELIGHLRLPV